MACSKLSFTLATSTRIPGRSQKCCFVGRTSQTASIRLTPSQTGKTTKILLFILFLIWLKYGNIKFAVTTKRHPQCVRGKCALDSDCIRALILY